jgi:Type II restriction endonuclease EcoO109I
VDGVLADKDTSAIEAHLGTFLEEVARIVSGGIKPGSGVDLQLERDGVVQLYAIQASGNTKNSGGRQTDIAALKRAARPLRASKRYVELNITVLGGRAKTRPMPSEPDITVLGSDDFWAGITGIPDFRARLLELSVTLAPLVKTRSGDEEARLKREARTLFGDSDGGLKLDVVANPPKKPRKPRSKKAKLSAEAPGSGTT